MEAILYFALWAGLIFFLMRFGCGAHMMGHGRGHQHGQARRDGVSSGSEEPRWIAPMKALDPVCGKSVSTNAAKPSVFDGRVYYLCSRECREVFEAAPDTYVGGDPGRNTGQLEHSHV